MAIHPNYKKPKITSGDLDTPVIFFGYEPSNSPEPEEQEKNVLHSCFAEIYSSSMKDMEIVKSSGKATKQTVTINIRDPDIDYLPSNKHKAKLEDIRYKGVIWELIDVAAPKDGFIKIILGATS